MYTIESPVHGVYTGIDWSTSGQSYGPRFRWSIPRSDGILFSTVAAAEATIDKLKSFKHYAWKKPSWINNLYVIDIATGATTLTQKPCPGSNRMLHHYMHTTVCPECGRKFSEVYRLPVHYKGG